MKIFISHAFEDTETIARPLAESLRSQGYEVWYDEYSLKPSDSLSQEIDNGIAQCDYGVVIISPSFFAKKWTRIELDGLVVREVMSLNKKNIIVPIWHNVSQEEVARYSPTLAARFAVSTKDGLNRVISEINRVTQFISPERSSLIPSLPQRRSAKPIINNIVPAGPIQPDGGLFPDAIKTVEDFVERWDKTGELNLLVKVKPMSREVRKQLFNEEKFVFLLPDHAMHQVRIDVVDISFQTIGMVWTPPNISDSNYHKALNFFLWQMGFLKKGMVKVLASPIINSEDSFWVMIADDDSKQENT